VAESKPQIEPIKYYFSHEWPGTISGHSFTRIDTNEIFFTIMFSPS